MIRSRRSKIIWALFGMSSISAWMIHKGSTHAEANLGAVKRADLIQRVTVAGMVTPLKKTLITAPYNGYVRKLFAQVGDRVHAGQPVVTLAQSLLTSREEVFPLRAPIDGVIVQVLKHEGEYVDQGASNGQNAIVRIDDLNHLQVEANAPEMEIDKLKIGQEVVLKASALLGREFHGRIQTISLAAKEQSQWEKSRVEFPVFIQITDSDPALKPGMSVIVDIVARKIEKILTLKHEYIQQDGERYFVTLRDGRRQPIQVGVQNEEAFEIKEGLVEGDLVRQVDFLEALKNQAREGAGVERL